MLFLILLLGIFERVSSVDTPSNYAVLIAGSNGYYNYRHQSDISHAYQILRKLGNFPRENVIVMMYNDVANSTENPFPGQLFNEPGGDNVYNDIHIDYQGNNVTAQNFLNVLKGNSSGVPDGYPVLKSGPNDHVFIYYSDHGATGLVAMPTGQPLYANELINALNYMYNNKMYNQLVFYLEACESGSMFNNILPDNISIFATTAANPDESSYAYYYNSTLGTYMADEYSIRWMQDTTKYWNNSESLIKQFEDVKNAVKQSHPQKYGDFQFIQETINEFEGFDDFKLNNNNNNMVYGNNFNKQFQPSREAVDSRNVKLFTLQLRYLDAKTIDDKNKYKILIEDELKMRSIVDHLFKSLVEKISGVKQTQFINSFLYQHPKQIKNWQCLKQSYKLFNTMCYTFNDYSLQYVKTLVNLCEFYNEQHIMDEMHNVCAQN